MALSPSDTLLLEQAARYATPQTIPAIQRSAYLAEALRNIQASSGNIRTPAALGTTLLAEALTQYNKRRADQSVITDATNDRNSYLNAGPSVAGWSPPMANQPQAPQSSSQGVLDRIISAIHGNRGGAPVAPPQAPSGVIPGNTGPSGAMVGPGSVAPQADSGLPPPNAATPQAVPDAVPVVNAEDADKLPVLKGAQYAAAMRGEPLPPPDWTGVGKAHDLLTRLSIGEAHGAAPQKAVDSVVMTRANESGLSPDQVAQAPGQFEPLDNPQTRARLMGIDPNSPQYRQASANLDQVINNGPTVNADHFWSPQAQAALGRQPPAWAQPGQNIGGNVFTQAGYSAPANPPPMMTGAPQQMANASPMGGAQPYQVASNGQTPPPPSAPQLASPTGGAGAPLAPPMPGQPMPTSPGDGSQMPGNGQPPGGGSPGAGGQPYFAPPTGPKATPAELQQLQSLYAMAQHGYPGALEQFKEYQSALATRERTPLKAPENMQWDSTRGQFMPLSGTTFSTISNGPAGSIQANPFGQQSAVSNPNVAPPPSGMSMSNGPNGPTLSPIQGSQPRALTDPKERLAAGILPSDRNGYAMAADGKVVKVAENPYGPKEIQSVHDNFWNSDETKKAQEAYSAFRGMTTALAGATKNNGPLDQAGMDSFLRGINPGMGARNSTVQMVMTHFGFPQELSGYISGLLGNGFVTPESLQQMLQITHDYAVAHQQAAQARAQSDAKMVAPYGYGSADLAEDLPQLGVVPQIHFGSAPGGAQQPVPTAPAGSPAAASAEYQAYQQRAAAEARRRGLIK